MKLEGISVVEVIALGKAVSDADVKEASGKLAEGEYDVDFTVRVNGGL